MAVAVIIAIAVGISLLLILARYASHPAALRAEVDARAAPPHQRPDIDPSRLRTIVGELLPCMGLRVVEAEPLRPGGATRLVALGHGVLREARHIVYLEPRPTGEVVDATELLALAEDVTQNEGTVGVIITPHRIDRAAVAGIEADLELIDGAALEALVMRYLPARAEELSRYRLLGSQRTPLSPRQQAWSTG